MKYSVGVYEFSVVPRSMFAADGTIYVTLFCKERSYGCPREDG